MSTSGAASRCLLLEPDRGRKRAQILDGVIRARQRGMTRQIRERAVEFGAGRALPLPRAAAAEGVQLRVAGYRGRAQVGVSHGRDGRYRGDRRHRRQHRQSADCKET